MFHDLILGQPDVLWPDKIEFTDKYSEMSFKLDGYSDCFQFVSPNNDPNSPARIQSQCDTRADAMTSNYSDAFLTNIYISPVMRHLLQVLPTVQHNSYFISALDLRVFVDPWHCRLLLCALGTYFLICHAFNNCCPPRRVPFPRSLLHLDVTYLLPFILLKEHHLIVISTCRTRGTAPVPVCLP